MSLKGKDYLPVAARITAFREAFPIEKGWRIVTELMAGGYEQKFAVVRATVLDPGGAPVATGVKMEDKAGFADFLEKAETGAIGRALGLCGFGTLYAQEFDEGGDVCDSPVTPKGTAPSRPRPSSTTSTTCVGCGVALNPARMTYLKAKGLKPLCVSCEKKG